MREYGLDPLHFNWLQTAMRFTTLNKILQADVQLSTRSDDCWSSHNLSVMEGLAHSHIFKHHLLNCETIDLISLVVDPRNRHQH